MHAHIVKVLVVVLAIASVMHHACPGRLTSRRLKLACSIVYRVWRPW